MRLSRLPSCFFVLLLFVFVAAPLQAAPPVGSEFRVNTYTTLAQSYPSVAVDSRGDFMVVWVSASQEGTANRGIYAQRYDASGAVLGPELHVDTYASFEQKAPAIMADANDDFIVIWQSANQDRWKNGVFARRMDAIGNFVGAEFQVNTTTANDQDDPAIAADGAGNFVVVWRSYLQDGSFDGIFAQRFGDTIFGDDFESGGVGAWSGASTLGDSAVVPAAAMAGTLRGLQAVVTSTASRYVEDPTPAGEARYRARFYFDPDGFDPGTALGHTDVAIFGAYGENPVRRVAALILRRQAGQYSIAGEIRLDGGQRVKTSFVPISNSPHRIELDWERAYAPGAADGRFELWIDGASSATRAGLDNDLASVDFVRLGALSLQLGAQGTLYWDQFESRRQSYIGE